MLFILSIPIRIPAKAHASDVCPAENAMLLGYRDTTIAFIHFSIAKTQHQEQNQMIIFAVSNTLLRTAVLKYPGARLF